MINSVRLINFKNFESEFLPLGAFTLIVGANASGKSNICDALRFLSGIGRGYTVMETLTGKYGVSGQPEWHPLRGANNEIARHDCDAFTLDIELQSNAEIIDFSLGIQKHQDGRFFVRKESMNSNDPDTYQYSINRGQDDDRRPVIARPKGKQRRPRLRFQCSDHQPALTQIPSVTKQVDPDAVRQEQSKIEQIIDDLMKSDPSTIDESAVASLNAAARKASSMTVNFLFQNTIQNVSRMMSNIRFLDPSPSLMRIPSFPDQSSLGDHGENFPSALMKLCLNKDREHEMTEWIRELTPMDVKRFEFPKDESGRIHVKIREQEGREFSIYSASDGTLRFLALLLALLDEGPSRVYVFEEIDNGIHPGRLELLLRLIESRTSDSQVQVVATTHSPLLLSMISEETFESCLLVARRYESSDSVIRKLSSLPSVRELRDKQGLDVLHLTGWMEDMIAFDDQHDTEDSEDCS